MKKQPKQAAADVLALVTATKGVDATELAQELLAAFGGPRAFAEHYRGAFENCPSGGIARTRMLQGVISLLSSVAARAKGTVDLSGLTDEDLQQSLAGVVGKLLKAEVTTHAQEATTAPAAA